MIHFVLGGARSGKSRFAEYQIIALSKKVNKQAVYIATATAFDQEMGIRIAKHQSDRAQNEESTWQLIECPINLAETLQQCDRGKIYLLDCLTLWLNNLLFSEQVQEIEQGHKKSQVESSVQQEIHLKKEINNLLTVLNSLKTDIVIVSNEVGSGIVPLGQATRLYVDYCGWLNQEIAQIAQKVTLVTAGIPLTIKPEKTY